jgi:formylglycine-generating enzyme
MSMSSSRRPIALSTTLLALAIAVVAAERPLARADEKHGAAKTVCPKEMTANGNYCIDRWEGHLLRREPNGTLGPHPHHARPSDGEFVAASEAGVRPQGYISRNEAKRACENAGKRLCSVNEWYAVCRGAERTTYPYGPRYEKGRCNVGKAHLLSLLFGKDPKSWRYDEHFNAPELDQRPGFLASTGEYAGCAGSNGVYDMVGNLHEWVSDRVDLSLAEKLPLTDGIRRKLKTNTGKGIFMGGFFSTTDQHGQGCNFVTAAHEPAYHDYSTGFRCCKDQ